jgi:hypothetical protein
MRAAALPDAPYRTSESHAEDYDLWVRLARRTSLDNLAVRLLDRRVHGASVSDLNAAVQDTSTVRIQQRAIAAVLGREPSASQIAALASPQSPGELLSAALLITRLYLASGGGAAVRRDARNRLLAAAKALWFRR